MQESKKKRKKNKNEKEKRRKKVRKEKWKKDLSMTKTLFHPIQPCPIVSPPTLLLNIFKHIIVRYRTVQ